MIDRGLIPHERLLERFEDAKIEFAHDARMDDLKTIAANLNRVERDLLMVPETEIEFPSWV